MKRRAKVHISSSVRILLFLVLVTWSNGEGTLAQGQELTVTPSRITLETAGKPVRAQISGTSLTYIQSLQVIRRGVLCREITAKRITSRVVEFRAAANATPARDYQLRAILRIGGRIRTVDIPTTVFSIGVIHVDRPDLVITNVVPGQSQTLIVYISNQGRGSAQLKRGMTIFDYKIYHYVRDRTTGLPTLEISPTTTTHSYAASEQTISPGRAAGYVIGEPNPLFTAYISFRVDPYGQIIESNENNNTYTFRYQTGLH